MYSIVFQLQIEYL